MSVYTVHEPPLRAGATAPEVDRYEFVRDGFSFWAFLFGPLWMLRHRMWLVLIGYVVVSVGLDALVKTAGAPNFAVGAINFLISLLVGLEAGTLRRFTLGRRRFRNVGVVSGHDRDDAEHRFFDAWMKQAASRSAAPPPASSPPLPGATSPSAPVTSGPDVIGLFPEPGASR